MESLARTANRGSVSTGYDIDYSLKFENDNAEGLTNNYSGDGTPTQWTFSGWVKRSEIATDTFIFAASYSNIRFIANNWIRVEMYTGSATYYYDTTALFKDTSAWLHIVFKYDSTQGTAANRTKLWVNGVLNESFGQYDTHTNLPQNATIGFGEAASNFQVGYSFVGGVNWNGYCGYMAELHYTDGVLNDADAFGEFDEDSGIWKPKEYTGSHGSKGVYLKFDDSSDLGANSASGGVGDFTLVNITAADQATDTPTNNFCTLNPLMANAGPTNYLPITEGGTKAVNDAAVYKIANSTFGVTSGKWYWEVKATDVNGVTAIGVTMPNYWDADYTLQGCIYYGQTGQRYNNASASSFGNTYTDGDIISFALDMDATPPTMTVYKNNSSEGNLMSGLSINGAGAAFLPEKEGGYFPKIVGYNANTFECNFGGYTSFTISSAASDENGYGTFEYAPPSGYYALCTKNLAEYG